MTKTAYQIADTVLSKLTQYKQAGLGVAILDGMYRGRKGGAAGILGGALLGGAVGAGGTTLLEKKKEDTMKKSSSDISNSILTKLALSFTPEGHEYDAQVADIMRREAIERALLSQEQGTVTYKTPEGKESPGILRAIRYALSSPAAGRSPHPTRDLRRMTYIKGKHEAGENPWNPFGGLFTPAPEEKGGTSRFYGRVTQPEKTMKKESFSVTPEGHEYDRQLAEILKKYQLERARLDQEQDVIQYLTPEGGTHRPPFMRALRYALSTPDEGHPTMRARDYDYLARRHGEGRNPTFGNLLWGAGTYQPIAEEEGGTSGFWSQVGRVKD
jgi:hypothetical protein